MIQVEAFIRSFKVAWTPLKETDIVGYRVHAVKAVELVGGDFVPSENNLIYDGPETSLLHVLPEDQYGGFYYIKIGGYDTFGKDEMLYSDMVSVFVPDLQIMPDELFTSLRTDFYIRDTTFLFGQVAANGTRTNETTLYWDNGWIDRADKVYTLLGGSIVDAHNSYIIATLVDEELGVGTATVSKVAFDGGLPTLGANQIIIAVTTGTPNSVGNYMAYVRQGNSMMLEGAYIRDATIGDAKIYGTLSANKIQTLNGGVVINDQGITLNNLTNTASTALNTANTANSTANSAVNTANSALNAANLAATTASWGGLSNTPTGYNILKDTIGTGLKITSSFIGFYGGGSVASYLDNLGNFYLQGSDPNHSLTWNSTNNTLRVRGDVEASSFKSTSFVLNGPNGQIRSANYVSGSSGWAIDYLGYAQFNNVYARGNIEASSLKVGTAMVDTLHIAGNAVTVPVIATGGWAAGNGGWQVVCSTTVTITQPGTIQVLGVVRQSFINNGHTWYYRISINGDLSNQVGGTWVGDSSVAISHSRAIAAGTHTVQIEFFGGDSLIVCESSTLTILGVMR